MRILFITFLLFVSFQAFSQGPVDRIELGYQSTRRGIVWVRPGLPTHEPVWRISRDTNSILWHNLTTGIRYDWSYESETWNRKDVIYQTLPPIESITSGLATIDNTTADWINDNGISHFYDNDKTAWVPHGMSYQSAAPTDVAAGVSNAAATYTTTLWQDSDDFLIRYWDGDSWELIGGVTNLTYTGTSSPLTLNSSTGTDVTITAGTGISLTGSSTNMTITNTAPDQTVSITGGGINVVTGTYPNFTITGTEIGTVSSVGLALPVSVFSVSGSPVTSSGTLTGAFTTQTASTVFAGPTTGGAAAPTFRALVAADIPALPYAPTLSGVQYQVGFFDPANTLTTESGSGVNALTWDATNNRLGVGTSAPLARLHISGTGSAFRFNNAAADGFSVSQLTTNSWAWSGLSGGMFFNLENADFILPPSQGSIGIGTAYSTSPAAKLTVIGNGATSSTWAAQFHNSTGTSNLLMARNDGRIGILTASPAQTLHVQGTARITGSDGTATTVTGRDADGDISALSLSGMSISAGTLTATDGSTTNELQTLANTSDATSHTVTLSNSGGSFQLVEGSGVTLTTTGTSGAGIVTIAATGAGTDLTFSGTSSPVTLNSSTGTDVTYTAGTGISISASSSNLTVTNSAPDQTVSITNGGGVSVSGTYPNFTLTATDASATNEAQTLSVSGTTSGILSLNAISGAGGGTATIAAGTGITVGQSGGTITITNSSPATSSWLLDGNTITAAKRIGSNDNFDVVVETNGTDRMWFDNAGTVSIGATQLTTAALNINGLQTGTGMLISGGSSLVGPNFYTATGSGSGSTATVLSGVLSMLSGNVEGIMKNTVTSGTGGGALFTVNVSPTATSNDAFFKWQTDGVTDWSMGIDNDDLDDLKLHRFSRPSDNNGQGTIEFGYRTNDIGMAINKTGIGTVTNGFYAVDVGGKVRTDQYVNNSLDLSGAAFATIAVGSAAGTSPTVDNTVTSVWGNGARLKFTSGTSPTANGVVCTITLDTQYTFSECIPIMQGRSTNAGAFNYSCSYNSGTRVITCTLVGTLTASTVYEFNLLFFGRN